MSDKKLNAIKEIEFRIKKAKECCTVKIVEGNGKIQYSEALDEIDNLLFDINDFINDLKDE